MVMQTTNDSLFFKNLDNNLKKDDREEIETIRKELNTFFNKENIVEFVIFLIDENSKINFIDERSKRLARSKTPNFLITFTKESEAEIKRLSSKSLKESKIMYFQDQVISTLTDQLSIEIRENNPETSKWKLLKRTIQENEVDDVEFIQAFASSIFSIDTGDRIEDELLARLLFI